MSDPLKVVIVEDSEDDLLLLLRALRQGGYDPEYTCVADEEEFRKALKRKDLDIILSDYRMPQFSGEMALKIGREVRRDVPFIVVSGAVGEEAAVKLMKCGAHDFVRKDKLDRLIPAIRRELTEMEIRRQRKIAEEALRESEEKFRTLVNSSPDAIFSLDTEMKIRSYNAAASRMWGDCIKEMVGKTLTESGLIAPDSRTQLEEELKWVLREEDRLPFEVTTHDCEGMDVYVEANSFPIRHEGKVVGIHMTLRDVTEKRKLEEQLRLAQKMEAIGQLAGGVAHDFNNQLSGIIGCSEILRNEVSDTPHLVWYANTIISAAERAAGLTRQLLAFARKNKYQTVPVKIHQVIEEVIALLKHTLDPRIEIKTDLQAKTNIVLGDPSQLQNAILNLAVNARDAMPNGGTLTFTTKHVELDAAFCKKQPTDVHPGRYIEVGVNDTGGGIPKDILPHIFEPFFTTKERGKGTGLGLAAVYGTITGHNGALTVDSSKKGSAFRLYLPIQKSTESKATNVDERGNVRGSGHILVIDDEEIVRCIAERMLKGLGYTVTVCENGSKAIEYFRENHEKVDLVLLDMVMPKMNGRDTYMALHDVQADVKVVLSTGHALGHEIQELLDMGVLGLLQKPFRIRELSRALADALQ